MTFLRPTAETGKELALIQYVISCDRLTRCSCLSSIVLGRSLASLSINGCPGFPWDDLCVCCMILVPKHTNSFPSHPCPLTNVLIKSSSSDIFVLTAGTFAWLSKLSQAISIALCILLLYAWTSKTSLN